MAEPTEEERRRKIIIDSQVTVAASKGISAVLLGQLTGEQIQALIKCDEYYLQTVSGIAPSLVESYETAKMMEEPKQLESL